MQRTWWWTLYLIRLFILNENNIRHKIESIYSSTESVPFIYLKILWKYLFSARAPRYVLLFYVLTFIQLFLLIFLNAVLLMPLVFSWMIICRYEIKIHVSLYILLQYFFGQVYLLDQHKCIFMPVFPPRHSICSNFRNNESAKPFNKHNKLHTCIGFLLLLVK